MDHRLADVGYPCWRTILPEKTLATKLGFVIPSGKMLDDMLAFLHTWWTTNPMSWDSEFFTLPPVHADLRPVQAGGPPIWIGGASEAAMRRVGRSGVGRLGFDGPPAAASINGRDEGADRLWSIARRAAQDAGRDPDALKTAMRINLEPGTSVGCVTDWPM